MSGTVSYIYNAPPIPGMSAMLIRSTDNAFIPLHLDNQDYQNFLSWVEAGNTPPEGWTGPTNKS